MRQLLKKIIKALAYIGAALVIFLAIAVGLFRLLLPRLPEYQDEIKSWTNEAIGMQVEFADMDARWRLSGPELTFQDAELTAYGAESSLLMVGEVSVSVSLIRLLSDRELVVDRIKIRDTKFSLQLSEQDGWLIQGLPVAEIFGSVEPAEPRQGNVVIVAEDVTVDFLLPDSNDVLSFTLDNLEAARDETRLVIDALVDLPDSLGQRMVVSASQHTEEAETGQWQIFLEGKELSLPGWSALQANQAAQFRSGTMSLSASLQVTNAVIDRATGDLVIIDVAGAGEPELPPIDVQGRLEYSKDNSGWLVAASNLVVSTVDGAWPRSTFSVEVNRTPENELEWLSASASYLNLDDWRYLAGWLPEKFGTGLRELDPSGALQDLQISLDGIQGEQTDFSVDVEFLDAGVSASESWPGLRNVSGLIRTDNFGGLLEVDSAGLIVDLRSHLAEPISFDDAIGTVIWRRNAQGTIVLSDNIQIRNADLDSRSSLQISIPSGPGAPVVDFNSDWSLNDISAVSRYLPLKLISPGLYRWLSAALVEGNVPAGTTRLNGPLDKFPFDNGEGVFRIETRLENTTLRYSDKWPDAKNMTLDVVVDGLKLVSDRNSSINAGNSIENAHIEIADLRQPILVVEAYATGSLESIRAFSRNSPIANVFGGHLDEVSVEGDASFNVNFSFPILDRDNYTFSTRIQTNDGSMSFAGFQPALTELNGIVNVSREGISAESLFGRFLGEPVNIELKPAGVERPYYSIIAEMSGRLSAEGLVSELAPPLASIINGSTNYLASIQFPKAGLEQPMPLQIVVDTDLSGMAIDLPLPLNKPVDTVMPLTVNIAFPEAGRIETTGTLVDQLNWTLSFLNSDRLGWDFDRGTLSVGGTKAEPPEIRGLHIVGEVERVSLDDWLAVARSGSGNVSIADRIRSVDLTIGNLHVIGQDLKNHRVEVQRSAQDWFVELSGEQASGSITVPYDFDSGRPLIVDMETLVLPGADETLVIEDVDSAATDPRKVPPLSISAKNFALGDRFFGELKAEFASTELGIESISLVTRDADFSVEGSAGWIVDAGDDSGQRTYLKADLLSSNIESTMTSLNYEAGVSGKELRMDLDLTWPGGPGEDFMSKLDGTVALRLNNGMLVDVEPGAGRVFGLMSVVALPRRLSLDFRDVFDKGFSFDTIKGNFIVRDGQAYTCDLSLEGPAADVGIIGRAGLATRDYDQTAIVSANIGNTLPFVGAVVAGPQVAAALFIFSQIFKKPLNEVGQVYYGIDGSWDAPEISTVNADRFAANSVSAGCIEALESD